MKTLKEYLERNSYNIVKSLAELLSISDEEAKEFYKALSLDSESKTIDALKEPIDDAKIQFVKDLHNEYLQHVGQDNLGEDLSVKAVKDHEIDLNDPMNDEVEDLEAGKTIDVKVHEEEQLDELSPKTLKSYVKNAASDAAHKSEYYGAFGHDDYMDTANRRHKGIEMALDKLHPEEKEAPAAEEMAINDPKRFEIKSGPEGYDIFDNRTGKVVTTTHSGHEAHNELFYYRAQARKEAQQANESVEVEEAKKPSKEEISRMAGKKEAGGYDMARELSKGQYQPKIVQNKKFKDSRQADKSNLKRGVFENSITPVLVTEGDEFKFKILNSSAIATQSNVKAIFESTVMVSPMGGMSAVPGIGMSGLRKMAGIAVQAAAQTSGPGENMQDLDMSTELESNDVNDVLAMISQMDDDSKACLLDILSQPTQEIAPSISAEQLETVKCALRDFGAALQCWIEDSCGALDFLCPLVDTLWVKYNEFDI